jgi:hypothetical protein
MSDVNAKANKPNAAGADRLTDLNVALMGVENDLQGRALERARDDADRAYEFINQAAEAGLVDIHCGDEEAGESDVAVDGDVAPAAEPEFGEEEEAPGEGDAAS